LCIVLTPHEATKDSMMNHGEHGENHFGRHTGAGMKGLTP